MSGPSKAVFLSYASQDAEAAKRICDALRQAGVEVWFDQSELVGGDAWDQKIRKQIKECALLIPIISKSTQGRREAYFRLEWRLAEERTHLMAKGTPFLLPVTIDGTGDREALVPDSFLAVQWTKAPGGEVPPTFVARVQKLLSGGIASLGAEGADPGRTANDKAPGSTPPATVSARRRRWITPALMVGALVAATIAWTVRSRPPAASAPLRSPADESLARVSELLSRPEMARAELELADGLCRKAAELAPTDPDVFAAWSTVHTWTVFHGYDRSPERIEAARSNADKAMHLAPRAYEARLAQALFWVRSDFSPQRLAEAQKLLRQLLLERPDEPRALFALGFSLRTNPQAFAEGIADLERLARNPGFTAVALNEVGWLHYFLGRFALAQDAADRSVTARPYWNNLGLQITLALHVHGDTERAKHFLAQMPASILQEDWGVGFAWQTFLWSREPQRALEAVESVQRDWVRNFFNDTPRAYLLAVARQAAGQQAAARRDYERALAQFNQALAKDPNNGFCLLLKAVTQRELGQDTAALETYRLVLELKDSLPADFPELARLQFEPPAAAVDFARTMVESPFAPEMNNTARVEFTAAALRLNPWFDRLRHEPGFPALIAEAAARDATAAPGAPALKADEKSVAVLAFANLSDDKANEYFSDGISEELLNVLSKVQGLKVSARTSAFYFKGKEVPIPEIARQLGVAYVVEGSVRKAGEKVRITAQLIKAADGFHVWSETFTRDLKDIFAVQDEIAGLIAKNLELKMGITAARPTIDLEAYQEYLTGRALFAKAGNGDLQEAVKHFEKAVAIEPKFTVAWVQLASAHTQLGRWGGAPTLQSWPAARTAIDRARALEPDSPEVLLALGWILRTSDWDWRGAEQAFRRSLQLRPNHPDTLAGLAVLLFNIGQKEEAFRLGQQAAQLDPLNPATQIDLSLMFYLNNNLTEAERSARRALQLAPGGAGYHCILAWSLIKQGRLGEAETEVGLDSDAIEKPLTYGLLALGRGQGAVAREKLAELEAISRTNGSLADVQNSIAWIAVGLGEMDRPFAALEKARDSRDPSNSWLRSSPYLDPLQSDPRWNVLLHQVGLADDQLK
jgi:TolB-like protein/Flp pilus assembly protein TadD